MSNKRFNESGYQKKLRSPHWQKRRLELLSAAGWKCSDAGCRRRLHQHAEYLSSPPTDDPPSLEIHHLYYEWGRDPWDYPDDAFLVLCDECHEKRAIVERTIKRELVKRFRLVPVSMIEDAFWEMIEAQFPVHDDKLNPAESNQ